jgi:hypothetical protein
VDVADAQILAARHYGAQRVVVGRRFAASAGRAAAIEEEQVGGGPSAEHVDGDVAVVVGNARAREVGARLRAEDEGIFVRISAETVEEHAGEVRVLGRRVVARLVGLWVARVVKAVFRVEPRDVAPLRVRDAHALHLAGAHLDHMERAPFVAVLRQPIRHVLAVRRRVVPVERDPLAERAGIDEYPRLGVGRRADEQARLLFVAFALRVEERLTRGVHAADDADRQERVETGRGFGLGPLVEHPARVFGLRRDPRPRLGAVGLERPIRIGDRDAVKGFAHRAAPRRGVETIEKRGVRVALGLCLLVFRVGQGRASAARK